MDTTTTGKICNGGNEISFIRNGESKGTGETVNLLRSGEKFTATASSTLNAFTVDKIYDGNKTDNNGRWVSANSDTTPTVTIKFENQVTVNYVYIKNGYNSEFAKSVKIFADNTLVGDFTYGVAEKTFNLNNKTCKELKFVFDKGGYSIVRIFEIEIYGTSGSNVIWRGEPSKVNPTIVSDSYMINLTKPHEKDYNFYNFTTELNKITYYANGNTYLLFDLEGFNDKYVIKWLGDYTIRGNVDFRKTNFKILNYSDKALISDMTTQVKNGSNFSAENGELFINSGVDNPAGSKYTLFVFYNCKITFTYIHKGYV
jgi:hypothetical protein